jgi:ribosomal protein S27AE
MPEGKSGIRRASTLLVAIILVFVALSIAAFYYGINAYVSGRDGSFFLLIGFSGLAVSGYMLLQTRRKALKIVFKPYRIATTTLCPKCGFKNIREFQRGDYIFKEEEECPKCEEKMMIASIYREPEEEEKD